MTLSKTDSDSPISKVAVDLGPRSYDILIGEGLLASAADHISPVLRTKRVAVLTDENVAGIHLEPLAQSLENAGIDFVPIILPAGESSKSFSTYKSVMDQLLTVKIQRDEALIALGGGVIGDLTGFAAATLRRGVDFIQIPTSLLAQVDSSVGGKTGINVAQGKNLVGAFHQPRLVLADMCVLQTLPKRQLLAGYAEIVKYGLLGDFEFFNWLESNGEKVISGDTTASAYAVQQSALAKAKIVAEDEREAGKRALLNLGHTFGHALEAESGYGPDLLHGEAVAMGMIMAAELSALLGYIDGQQTTRIRAHFDAVGLPTQVPQLATIEWVSDRLLDHMRQDKKVMAGKLTLILLNSIGSAFTTQDVEEAQILKILNQELSTASGSSN
ncbi:MAG: 3-dehydroquinate synthase [Proteobacteria bacterium]|nr:3-dehydroquinate synthase [Pseudomonadota bacterium]